MHRFFLILLIITCSQSRAESIFGIELGAPFTLRNCDKADTDMGENKGAGLCNDKHLESTAPWGAIRHNISKPFSMTQFAPWGFQPYGFSVTEFEGVVTDITIATYGYDWQEDVLKDLITKFGKPTTIKRVLFQNLFGVKINGIKAHWVKPTYSVEFKGVSEARDTGFIIITTTAGKREERIAEKWRNENSGAPKM